MVLAVLGIAFMVCVWIFIAYHVGLVLYSVFESLSKLDSGRPRPSSLDDSEVAYCRVMLDEILGRQNFVATVVWQKALTRRNDTKLMSSAQDYILVYAKDIGKIEFSLVVERACEDGELFTVDLRKLVQPIYSIGCAIREGWFDRLFPRPGFGLARRLDWYVGFNGTISTKKGQRQLAGFTFPGRVPERTAPAMYSSPRPGATQPLVC